MDRVIVGDATMPRQHLSDKSLRYLKCADRYRDRPTGAPAMPLATLLGRRTMARPKPLAARSAEAAARKVSGLG
jgi:hypothetical protein